MKKTHYCTIGDAIFTWKGATIKPTKQYTTLYDCYNKPSQTKCFIWDTWKEWAHNNNFHIWVSSYNTNIFTIAGIGKYNGRNVYIYITPTRQEIHNIV